MRFQSRYKLFLRSRSNVSSDSSSTPAAPRFTRTVRHALHTSRFGMSNGFAEPERSSPFGLAADNGSITRSLRSSPITEPSSLLRIDPPLRGRIGTLGLALMRLTVSLSIDVAGSYSSVREPESSSRHLYAGHRASSKQVSDALVPGQHNSPGFDVVLVISTLE